MACAGGHADRLAANITGLAPGHGSGICDQVSVLYSRALRAALWSDADDGRHGDCRRRARGIGRSAGTGALGIEAEVFEAAPALGEIGAAVNVAPNATRALVAIGLGEKIAAVANSSPGIYTRNMQTGELLEFNDRRKSRSSLRRAILYVSPRGLAGCFGERARSPLDPSGPSPRRGRGAKRKRRPRFRQRRQGRSRARDRRRRGALGHPPCSLRTRQSHVYGANGLARAVERQRCPARRARADRAYPMGGARLSSSGVLHPRREAREHRHARGYRQMGRGGLVDSRRPRRDARELSEPGAAARKAPQHRDRMLEMGPVHATADGELGPRPHPADRRCSACHAAECRAGACQAFEDAYILARWLDACRNPVEAFASFRRIRIPRVHAVQRLSLANARFKHMRDSAQQKDLVNSGKGSVHGTAEWVWAYDPVSGWDNEQTFRPSTPTPTTQTDSVLPS